MSISRRGTIASFVFVIFLLTSVAGCGLQEDFREDVNEVVKEDVIDPKLQSALRSLGSDEKISVIVTLSDRVDLEPLRFRHKRLRRSQIIKALKSKARSTQGPLKTLLEQKGAKRISSLWIVNGMALSASADIILELAHHTGVQTIRLDAVLNEPEIVPASEVVAEWNLDEIRAPELWGADFTGQGVVVASMDTGVDIRHPDVADKWRGGANSWFDPHGEHDSPHDTSGHGTQVMGVMIGGNAGGSAIGVAPDAQWVAVKLFDDKGQASLSDIHLGFQWLLDPDGDPETDDAPDVVNNSWGLRDHVGECIPEFQEDVRALKAAGIAVVFSAGNDGPYPATSLSPGNYPESIAVGATDDFGKIASFSSRGPSACDGSLYPEMVAPGANIKTADLTSGGLFPHSYAYVSGTSIASAHVSGAIALLTGAVPEASISEITQALQFAALDLGDPGPDNDYGHGLIDVVESYFWLLNPVECTDADGDGFFAQSGCGAEIDCNDSDAAIHPWMQEIKHDGIDQDCNGYDMTIDIAAALYSVKTDSMRVEATTALGNEASLELLGYGPMEWNQERIRWEIFVQDVGGYPGILDVSGIEGIEPVTLRRTRKSLAVPSSPDDLRILRSGRHSITIAWADNSNKEKGFWIERAPSALGPFSIVGEEGPDATAYTDRALMPGQTYFYRIRAYNEAGHSPASGVLAADLR